MAARLDGARASMTAPALERLSALDLEAADRDFDGADCEGAEPTGDDDADGRAGRRTDGRAAAEDADEEAEIQRARAEAGAEEVNGPHARA